MIEIQHDAESPGLDDYVRNHSDATWDDFGREGDLKSQTKAQLRQLQGGLCIYCERKLKPDSDSSHIDHVKPKSKHPELTFHYHNMVCSCNSLTTCGHFKKDHILPIEPGPDCNKYFYLHSDGVLCPRSGAKEDERKARETVDKLGLNDSGLQQDRKNWLRTVKSMVEKVDTQILQTIVQEGPFPYLLRTLQPFEKG